ncbi:MAG: hybrid sensor histidine kinase/response regulator [Planctomycetota bacterium]|nr:hybrid sensor histidine kinase/response regulator [Planctomycetota bacterium]
MGRPERRLSGRSLRLCGGTKGHRVSGQQDFSNSSMLDLFRMELETHAAVLNDGLVGLAGGEPRPEMLAALMRAAHSIKGAARIVGLQPVVEVAHAMEDCFVRAQEGKLTLNAEHVELFLQATDFFNHSTQGQPDQAKAAKLVAEFQAHKAGAGASSASIPSVPPKPPAAPASPPAAAPPKLSAAAKPRSAKSSSANKAVKVSAPTPTAAALEEAGAARAVRVNADSLSRLMGLAGETLIEAGFLERYEKSLRRLRDQQVHLSEAIQRLRDYTAAHAAELPASEALVHDVQLQNESFREMLAERLTVFEDYSLRTDNLSHRLYREVIASRMRPFADGIRGFPRLVHDISRTLGKKARLVVQGRNTEIDRDILEKLEAPLNHLLRNAVDHGLEAPADRAAADKPEQGTVSLEAVHKGGMLFVSVSDDGRGVDLDRVRSRIVERNLATTEMTARMTEHEILEFLFLPGFTTSSKVTEISGRGVGLDVVKTMVQEVSGQLRITTRPGQGCTFHIQLPITLSVISALLVEIGGDPYAFPLSRIARVAKIQGSEIQTIENYQFFRFDQQSIGLVPAQQVLDLEDEAPRSEECSVVVVGDRGEYFGLAVDRVLGERSIVVRPLDERLGRVPNINAAALMEDGRPLLILDVEDMFLSIRALLSGGRLQKVVSHGPAQQKARKRILVVDDSLTVREVERKLLENKGYEVEAATDGAEGWIALRSGRFDLVITDVDMPRMNGLELVSALRADARYKDLPVMIVSYKDREEDRLRGMEVGANYYLVKSSFHDESLLGAVFDLIGEAQ